MALSYLVPHTMKSIAFPIFPLLFTACGHFPIPLELHQFKPGSRDKSAIHKVVSRAIPSFAWYNANDTKIFRRISTKQDEVILQEDINEMLKWADQWQLEFHPDKCVKMSINKRVRKQNIQHGWYYTEEC